MTPSPVHGTRLHVLEVIGNAIVGGMETWVERLIERMPREQFRFTALCPFDGAFADRLRALDVEVVIVSMLDDPPWTSIQTVTALVAAGGIDLLHAHLPRAHLLAGIVGRLTGKPVLATIHGRQMQMLDLEVHRATGSHLSVVCRQSYFHALGLGVSAGHLSCEPNGVDTRAFNPVSAGAADSTGATAAAGTPRKLSELRAALGLPAETVLVGFIGRLSPEKGPEVFIRAAMLLRLREPDVHCVVAGEGPMAGELAHQVERLGLQQHLHFLGVRSDMPALYRELDVVVSSSHSEAMPLALMEAMACALPVVATRVGGVPDLVEHDQTGWLVAPGDFDDIAGRCAMLVADPAMRQRMGARGRQRVVERFDLSPNIARMGELFTRLAGTRAEGPRRVPSLSALSTPPAQATPAASDDNGAAAALPKTFTAVPRAAAPGARRPGPPRAGDGQA